MKTKIVIEEEAFAETRYYSGVYSLFNKDDDQPEKEYDFTLITQVDSNCCDETVMDITWVDKQPLNARKAEKEIKKHWEKGD